MAGAPIGNSNRSKISKPPRRVQDDIRAKIQAGNLVNRLEKHIKGEIALENSQLKAIEMLLDRTIPKLSAIEHSTDPDKPLVMEFGWRTTK